MNKENDKKDSHKKSALIRTDTHTHTHLSRRSSDRGRGGEEEGEHPSLAYRRLLHVCQCVLCASNHAPAHRSEGEEREAEEEEEEHPRYEQKVMMTWHARRECEKK